MSARARLAAIAGLALFASCGGRSGPYTAAEMARADTGDALVRYLHQPGATAAACDRTSQTPHLDRARDEDLEALVAGLTGGDVEPELWQRCAMLMLEHAPAGDASRLLDQMVHGHRALLSRSSLETDAKEQARTEAMHRALLLRPSGTRPTASAVAKDIAALRDALAKNRLGPVATRYGKDLLVAIDLEAGLWRGAKLSVEALDALVTEKDEASLRRIALRAPDTELQTAARRRVVRLHIAASSSRAAREHASEVEERVTTTGRNAIDVSKTPPASAWLDEEKSKVRGVLVRQDVWKQTATLLAYEGAQPGARVIPSLALRGAFWARVPGVDDPVTLCAPPDALDVAPCILPSELRPRVPIVTIDEQGLLHFVERVASADTLKLVQNTPNLPLPFEIAGREVLTIEWPIVFEKPDDLVFVGPTSGRGPDLRVTIARRYATRLAFDVQALGRRYMAIVEERDLPRFQVVTRGGTGTQGHPGSPGANGASGSAGMPASCPGGMGGSGGSGSPGGSGTAGGPGGPGGPGGDVAGSVSCVTGDCQAVGALVRRIVRSEGGAGGAGGQGGRGGTGGSGGAGGSGTSCSDGHGHYTYASGGSPGMKGADGSPGANGANGPSGSPGRVDLRVAD